MSAIVDPQARRHRLTVQQYHHMGEAGILRQDARVELIQGELIDITPVASEHAGVVKQLNELLSIVLHGKAIVAVQDPIVLGESSEPQPDLCVLQRREDFYRGAHPTAQDVLLVIEVSDTTIRYDREVKVPLYARHGIPEVWLLDLQEARLEVYHGPEGGEYRHVDYYRTGSVSPIALAHVSLDLTAIGFVRD